MKNIIKLYLIGAVVVLWACEEPETLTPVPATGPSAYSANFLFVNASPDAPSLDLLINNVKAGASLTSGQAQAAYNNVPIPSNGVLANTNIKSKPTTGTIGGTLGSSDLIYRATSTSINNFQASSGARYTLFALDSITRPVPYRTLNASNFGDVTYFSYQNSFTAPKIVGTGDTTIVLNVQVFGDPAYASDAKYASNNPVVAFNLVRKYNGGSAPTFMVPIGIVPLGSSDVGGLRFYLAQDVFPTYNASDSTTRAGFRLVNASPKSTGSAALRARLKYVSGTGSTSNVNLNGGNAASYILSNAGGWTPSVGSRTVTSASATFTTVTTAAGDGAPNTYTIELATDAGFTNIIPFSNSADTYTFGGNGNKASNYTVVISGYIGGTGNRALKVTVVEHN